MFIENLLHAKSCARLGSFRDEQTQSCSPSFSLVKEKSAWYSGKGTVQAVMSVQGGSMVQIQEMLPGRGDVFSLCWSVLLLQISPNIREFSFSVPSKLNAAPPLFGYLLPYIFRSLHKHCFLREASPVLTPHKSK